MRDTSYDHGRGAFRRPVLAAAAAAAVLGLAAPALAATSASRPTVTIKAAGSGGRAVAPSAGKVRYLARPNPDAKTPGVRPPGVTVPTTLYNITAGQNGQSYNFSFVGGNVTTGAGNTAVTAKVIPLIVTFPGTGDVYDPTVANSSCGEAVSPLTGLFSGPELSARNWYAGHTFVGHGQYTDIFQREEFWNYANPHGSAPNYGLTLNGTYPENATWSLNYPEVSPGTCSELGEVDYNTFDAGIRSFLNGIGPTTLPIILLKNVVLTQNGGATCCILGYHSSFTDSSGNTQTYSVGDYVTDGEFGSNTTDLVPLSHELAEWANDPFVNNPTPSWGHTGQVSGCQGNLEVGDPLSGTSFAIPPVTPGGGPTYHVQEMAFWNWFYDASAGFGVNNWYSNRGTFTSGAATCS